MLNEIGKLPNNIIISSLDDIVFFMQKNGHNILKQKQYETRKTMDQQ